jgi:hypothetical protein
MEYCYAEWLAARRGLEFDTALAQARKPLPARYEPIIPRMPPVPVDDPKIVIIDRWCAQRGRGR